MNTEDWSKSWGQVHLIKIKPEENQPKKLQGTSPSLVKQKQTEAVC